MSILAQGSELYFLDPDTNQVVKVECPTSFSPGATPRDQIEDTCLDSLTRTYQPGLATPAAASVALLADPQYASHVRLYELSQLTANVNIPWALGWSDGFGIPPTVDADGGFEFPTSRTWTAFEGYVGDFPFDFATNTLVATAMTIQRSGPLVWLPKAKVPA
jgi:hypothetical protein